MLFYYLSTGNPADWEADTYYFETRDEKGYPPGHPGRYWANIFMAKQKEKLGRNRIRRYLNELKRGPIEYRIKGYRFQRNDVLQLADAMCSTLNDSQVSWREKQYPEITDLAAKHRRQIA